MTQYIKRISARYNILFSHSDPRKISTIFASSKNNRVVLLFIFEKLQNSNTVFYIFCYISKNTVINFILFFQLLTVLQ